jgi:hypothetical protein
MTGDVGPRDEESPARRPGGRIAAVVAALLLLGGGTAVAAGLLGQDADPSLPAAASTSAPAPAPATMSPPASSSAVPVPSSAAPTPTDLPTAAPVELPVSVRIGSIGVESELLSLGTNDDGTVQVPAPGPDYDKAAWFNGSPRPGERGPAVLEGHVDSAKNGPSVFYDLGKVAIGDQIEVTRADGTTASFTVYETRVVPKNAFPTLDVYGNTSGPELRVITCGGPFDRSVRSYTDNIVVFAR